MDIRQDKDQVTSVIEEWAAALSVGDVERIKSTWDKSYENLIYLAEENNDAALGWNAIEHYYNGLGKDTGNASLSIDNIHIDIISDAAWAYLTFQLKAEIIPFNRTLTFNGRNTFILRKTLNMWKIIHYHESLSRDHSRDTWDWFFKK